MPAVNKIEAMAAYLTLGYLLPLMVVHVPCGKCYCPGKFNIYLRATSEYFPPENSFLIEG